VICRLASRQWRVASRDEADLETTSPGFHDKKAASASVTVISGFGGHRMCIHNDHSTKGR
jgi:hypothetical protein